MSEKEKRVVEALEKLPEAQQIKALWMLEGVALGAAMCAKNGDNDAKAGSPAGSGA